MPIRKFRDRQTGEVVLLDWNSTAEPSDIDIARAAQANLPPKNVPQPPGVNVTGQHQGLPPVPPQRRTPAAQGENIIDPRVDVLKAGLDKEPSALESAVGLGSDLISVPDFLKPAANIVAGARQGVEHWSTEGGPAPAFKGSREEAKAALAGARPSLGRAAVSTVKGLPGAAVDAYLGNVEGAMTPLGAIAEALGLGQRFGAFGRGAKSALEVDRYAPNVSGVELPTPHPPPGPGVPLHGEPPPSTAALQTEFSDAMNMRDANFKAAYASQDANVRTTTAARSRELNDLNRQFREGMNAADARFGDRAAQSRIERAIEQNGLVRQDPTVAESFTANQPGGKVNVTYKHIVEEDADAVPKGRGGNGRGPAAPGPVAPSAPPLTPEQELAAWAERRLAASKAAEPEVAQTAPGSLQDAPGAIQPLPADVPPPPESQVALAPAAPPEAGGGSGGGPPKVPPAFPPADAVAEQARQEAFDRVANRNNMGQNVVGQTPASVPNPPVPRAEPPLPPEQPGQFVGGQRVDVPPPSAAAGKPDISTWDHTQVSGAIKSLEARGATQTPRGITLDELYTRLDETRHEMRAPVDVVGRGTPSGKPTGQLRPVEKPGQYVRGVRVDDPLPPEAPGQFVGGKRVDTPQAAAEVQTSTANTQADVPDWVQEQLDALQGADRATTEASPVPAPTSAPGTPRPPRGVMATNESITREDESQTLRRLFPDPAVRARIHKALGGMTKAFRETYDPQTGGFSGSIDDAISEAEQATGRTLRDEKGAIDPQLAFLLTRMGVGGMTGAAVDKDHPLRGAILGGVAGGAAGPGGVKFLRGLDRLRYEGMLAGSAQATNLIGNVGSLLTTPMIDTLRGDIPAVRRALSTYSDLGKTGGMIKEGFKEGWNAPTTTATKFGQDVRPIGPMGRTLRAVDAATKNVLTKGVGKTPEQAATLTYSGDPVTKAGAGLALLQSSLPGRLITPFARTAINLGELGSSLSPLRFASKDLRALTPTAATSTAGKVASEAALASVGPAALYAGLSGDGPSSPTASSIFGPLAFPYSVGRSIYDYRMNGKTGAGDAIRAASNQIPFISDIPRLSESPGRFVQQLLAQPIPQAALMVGDKTVRETPGTLDVLTERNPATRTSLPARRDFFGAPMQRNPLGQYPKPLYERDPRAAALGEMGLLRREQSPSLGEAQLTPDEQSRLQQLRGERMLDVLSPYLSGSSFQNVPAASPVDDFLRSVPEPRRSALATLIQEQLPEKTVLTRQDVFRLLQQMGQRLGTQQFKAERVGGMADRLK